MALSWDDLISGIENFRVDGVGRFALKAHDLYRTGEIDHIETTYKDQLLQSLSREYVRVKFYDPLQEPKDEVEQGMQESFLDGNKKLGWADASQRRLVVLTNQSPKEELLVLIHESMHLELGHSEQGAPQDGTGLRARWDFEQECEARMGTYLVDISLGQGSVDFSVIDLIETFLIYGQDVAEIKAGRILEMKEKLEVLPTWIQEGIDFIQSRRSKIAAAAACLANPEKFRVFGMTEVGKSL